MNCESERETVESLWTTSAWRERSGERASDARERRETAFEKRNLKSENWVRGTPLRPQGEEGVVVFFSCPSRTQTKIPGKIGTPKKGAPNPLQRGVSIPSKGCPLAPRKALQRFSIRGLSRIPNQEENVSTTPLLAVVNDARRIAHSAASGSRFPNGTIPGG